jgi:hypothetical protein
MNDYTPIDDDALISQVHRLAGQGHLKGILAANLIKAPEGSHDETAAALLAHPDFSKKQSSVLGLKAADNQKLSQKLSKFLETLGATSPISDQKTADKLLAKTHMMLMKAPGYSRLKANDKHRVAHKILSLAAEGDTDDLHSIIEHEANHARAKNSIDSKIEALLSGKASNEAPVDSKERDRVKQYVEDNELEQQLKAESPQGYAQGGQVANDKPIIKDRVASAYPSQAMMLGGAKARVANYLNRLKPQKQPGLPFDSEMPDEHSERVYNHAIDAAARPLSVLDQVKDGSIEPHKFKHFVQMHPELHELLKKKITQRITEGQVNEDKKPPFQMRQALSVFMTNPLERSFTPQAILAAQGTFQPQQPTQGQQGQPQGGGGKKGSTKQLGKSNADVQTPLQAEARRHVEKD